VKLPLYELQRFRKSIGMFRKAVAQRECVRMIGLELDQLTQIAPITSVLPTFSADSA
jgi:hypothetical protein